MQSPEPGLLPKYQAYVDGSYQHGVTAFGAVILRDGVEVAALSGRVPPAMEGMDQVGGELQAVYEVVNWCQQHGVEKIAIFYDYVGIEFWVTGTWGANKAATREYAETMRNCPVTITWHKVKGHSGDPWNDRADALAAQATVAPLPEAPKQGA